MNDAIKMQISAFVDGELPENEAQLLLRRMSQDRVLRQQAATYLVIGRALRGERSVVGMTSLRERIAAAIDDSSAAEDPEAAGAEAPRYVRPLLGLAIAATVALVAIVGLQQTAGVPDPEQSPATQAATGYTVPEPPDDQLREYYLRHSASSSLFGTSSINARLVTLQLKEGVLVESDADNAEPADADAKDPSDVEPGSP
jgi:sigma-E factor negative regulatory protein RseA